ncbi:MAG TPA: serine/threonine protein phosphatase [Micromonosporaceae bacterium]|nr:serine/threonine protein phosphatase [Micromonosporaceae bacterium]
MALYVVGDVHGFLAQASTALREAGLIDEQDHWCGGDSRLWFLGDLTDRGPDGIGVIDLVRRLQEEAAAAGGEVGCVLGNHDMLLYGSRYVPESSVSEARSMIQVWALNGGQDSDLSGLDDDRARWLAGLPAVTLIDDHLLIHADTLAYLEFGKSIKEINRTFRDIMVKRDPGNFGYQTRQLFRRFDFLDPKDGVSNARFLLQVLGGSRVVHGHSTIPETFGISPSTVDGPMVYADGLVMAVDTGLALGAPCVVIELPFKESESTSESSPSQ